MRSAPADWDVLRARDVYLGENGFTVAAYDDPWTKATFLGLDFAVPNTKPHAQAIRLHDLHHVATGFGTDLAGEGEISAWELRGGLSGLGLYVKGIILAGAMLGLLIAPRRTLAAFRRGRGARSLWTLDVAYERLLAMRVAELRALVGAPPSALAADHALHARAPRAPSPT